MVLSCFIRNDSIGGRREWLLTHRFQSGHFGGQILRQPFVLSIQHVVHRSGTWRNTSEHKSKTES